MKTDYTTTTGRVPHRGRRAGKPGWWLILLFVPIPGFGKARYLGPDGVPPGGYGGNGYGGPGYGPPPGYGQQPPSGYGPPR